MLARAGLGRSIPRAGLMMAIAANAPDVDIVSWFGGTATYLDYHRGLTHALAFIPVMALLPVAIVWLIERCGIPWLRMWLASMIGVLSHLLLDWTNSYGIRLLLPFSDAWERLDTVFVVDPMIWVVLLLGIAAPALNRLVSSEIGAKVKRGGGWAVFVLLLLGGYEYGRYLAHERAVTVLDSRVYEGGTPLRTAAFARDSNPFAWKGVIETQGAYRVFSINLLEDFDPGSGSVFYKADLADAGIAGAIQAVREQRDFAALSRFSSFPLWRVTPADEPEGALRVELMDLRFGTPASPGLGAQAVVSGGRVSGGAVRFGPPQR